MPDTKEPRRWAEPIDVLQVAAGAPGTHNRTVDGRRPTGPLQGFGRLWQRTYRVALDTDADPTDVIRVWKDRYGQFWPRTARFDPPLAGILPGEIGLITDTTGPVRLSTGVLVLYADDTSFTYMTPEGHPFAGWITFSAHRDSEATIAQVQVLIRPSDPIFEVAYGLLGMSRFEDRMWQHTLRALAAYFGTQAEPAVDVVCVDRRRQWRNARNVRWNAALRTLAHGFGATLKRRAW
jgi:hypothetical protein